MLRGPLAAILAFLLLGRLNAQSTGCSECMQQDRPGTFNPSVLRVNVGEDVEAEVQFALPDSLLIRGAGQYVNYAFFTDSIRMQGGTAYVTLKGTTTTPVSYNNTNPGAGAIRFNALHRYKQVFSSPDRYAFVVVYQNPGGTPGQTPPRGCFRLCVRGRAVTSTPDTLRLFVRAFGQENTVRNDAPNKDTTSLMPFVNVPFQGRVDLWLDTLLKYPVEVRMSSSIQWQTLSHVKLYPNPAWGRVVVGYSLGRPAPVWIRIYSLAGSLLREETLGERPIGPSEYPLFLPAGAYVIELHTDKEVLREKLIVVE